MMMSNYNSYYFLNIETVAQQSNYVQLEHPWQKLWDAKFDACNTYWNCADPAQAYRKKAALQAEFGKIACISMGYFHKSAKNEVRFLVHTMHALEEAELIEQFNAYCQVLSMSSKSTVLGFGLKGFQAPYLCRRACIQGLPLPSAFRIMGKKGYELKQLIDLMELWKMGEYKHYASKELLMVCFGLEQKLEFAVEDLHAVYYDAQDMDALRRYSEQKLVHSAQLFQAMQGLSPISKKSCYRIGQKLCH